MSLNIMNDPHWLSAKDQLQSAIEELIQQGICKPQLNSPKNLGRTLDLIANASETSMGQGFWEIRRMDDNGTEFKLIGRLTRAQAEKSVAEYEARGLKQAYWAQPEAPRRRHH